MRTRINSKTLMPGPKVAALVVFIAILAISASAAPDLRNDGVSKSGIREEIPVKLAERYKKWKREFLFTEIGREQWESYLLDPNFRLTVTFDNQKGRGAGTGGYEWDEDGRLNAATITLGPRLNEGVPDPIYYPITASLEPLFWASASNGDILAATKIAHELGHVEDARTRDHATFQRQSELITAYNTILLADGHEGGGPRMSELTREMGSTPVEIGEESEYRAELNAMRFLNQRITDKSSLKALTKKITFNIKTYATFFTERFNWPADVTASRMAKR